MMGIFVGVSFGGFGGDMLSNCSLSSSSFSSCSLSSCGFSGCGGCLSS